MIINVEQFSATKETKRCGGDEDVEIYERIRDQIGEECMYQRGS